MGVGGWRDTPAVAMHTRAVKYASFPSTRSHRGSTFVARVRFLSLQTNSTRRHKSSAYFHDDSQQKSS